MTPGKAWSYCVARGESAGARPRELLSIQYLRAFAAIGVLVFHAAERAGVGFGPGAAGVDIFFVISGFIMWVISGVGPQSSLGFLRRRATRIVPLYWLVTLGVAATAIAVPAAFPNLRPTADHIVKSLLFYPHVDASGEIAPLIVPGWTLDYEMFFYALFAAWLLAASHRRLLGLSLTMGLLALAGYTLRPSDAALATYTNPLLLEFLAGVWLGNAWVEGFRLRRRSAIAAIVLGMVGFAVVAATGINVDPVRILVWGVPALLIVAGAISLEPLPDWPIAKFLGDASYSIYLVHGLAISFCARILTLLHIDSVPVFFIASLGGGLLLGGGCYRLVERPLLHLFRSRRRGDHRRRAPEHRDAAIAATRVLATPPDRA